ncbi:hypothetical protein ACT6QH_09455 [Xanthobacter sp. TB0139]|uniref:hypothetical protein n=1 Tax=Xanthobacter sp. TB0139 TaxID=3459178 RepID=UPI00403A62FA
MTGNLTQDQNKGQHQLADETFISADELREYMHHQEVLKANKAIEAMDRAEKARADFIKTLSEPVDLTPDRIHEISQNITMKMRLAAERGESEIMVMRFPNALCTDKGRAINNGESTWPETLVGRPRQAYELWRDHLRDANFKLKAMIVDWPNGMPGDVGMFVSWA